MSDAEFSAYGAYLERLGLFPFRRFEAWGAAAADSELLAFAALNAHQQVAYVEQLQAGWAAQG